MRTATLTSPVGELLKQWRGRRRLSQLDLALEAGVSPRHLSFVETGRSRPSREMVLHLAEHLEVPLRERNELLLAAGYAPVFAERRLDDPEMAPVREAVQRLLDAHEPHPAVVVDRRWDLVAANAPLLALLSGVAPHLLEPPVNVLRVALHPEGLAPVTANLPEWRAHLLARLDRHVRLSGDAVLAGLRDELADWPAPSQAPDHLPDPTAIAIPLVLRLGDRELRFISTVATFGTAVDVTLAELSIESFFPADAATAAAMRELAAG